MKTYTIYWSHGEKEILTGHTLAAALFIAGYCYDDIDDISIYIKGDDNSYEYTGAEWVRK